MIKIMVGLQKGGVGKSTTTSIVAEILAQAGYNVLVVDLDSQGNSTQMLTQRNIYEFTGKTVFEAMKERNPNPYVYKVKENLSIMPAEDMLSTFSHWVYVNEKTSVPTDVLNETLGNLNQDFDFVLMDCPPNLGDIVTNAMRCADYIVIPVQLESFSMDAMSRFVSFIRATQNKGYTQAEILGLVYTMVNARIGIQKAIGDAVRIMHKDLVFDSQIRLRAKIKDYALLGVQMDRKSDLAALEDYIQLTEELITRVKTKQNQ